MLSINLASLNRTLFVWYSEEYTRITETASSLVSRCFEKLSKNAKNTLKYIFSLITHRFQLTNRWCCQIRSVTILAGQLPAKQEEAKHTAHCPAMRSDATLKGWRNSKCFKISLNTWILNFYFPVCKCILDSEKNRAEFRDYCIILYDISVW